MKLIPLRGNYFTFKFSTRLNLDFSKFQCLNFANEFAISDDPLADGLIETSLMNNYEIEQKYFCYSPADLNSDISLLGGCAQINIPKADGFEISVPLELNITSATISTYPNIKNDSYIWKNDKSYYAPYRPVPYMPSTAAEGTDYHTETGVTSFAINNADGPYNSFAIYIPSYIGSEANMTSVNAVYLSETGTALPPVALANNCAGLNPTKLPSSLTAPETYCLENDAESGNYRIMYVKLDFIGNPTAKFAGVDISFIPSNTHDFPFTAGIDNDRKGMRPGNSLYYLTKLARMELLGIPQIFYEPTYCNSDRSKLVDGIFDIVNDSRAEFEANARARVYSPASNGGRTLPGIYDENLDATSDFANTENRVMFKDGMKHSDIFSEQEFLCCSKLGERVKDSSLCCSGAATGDSQNKICKLPKGTDLNVYFNRFISSEGVGDQQPGGGLEDNDFIAETGEIKLNTESYNKLNDLGLAYCLNASVRMGASMGNFYAQPNIGFYQNDTSGASDTELDRKRFGLVDSMLDGDGAPDYNGAINFQKGYRWSHHLYCQ